MLLIVLYSNAISYLKVSFKSYQEKNLQENKLEKTVSLIVFLIPVSSIHCTLSTII